MIIDIHSHVCAAPQLYRFKANLLASRGQPPHGFDCDPFSDEFVKDHPETQKNLRAMEKVGTDLQFLSPRPYQLMHGERPVKLVEAWAIANHDYIAQQVRLFPSRFRGVCALPQVGGEPVRVAFPELERCINELGFVGALIDSDPGEGDNSTPTLDNEYWYPLWEKMVELDIPGLIHSTGCKHGRETYTQHFITEESLAVLSLIRSHVYEDFPKLKIIVAHGGGSIPYQIGRWQADWILHGGARASPIGRSHQENGGSKDVGVFNQRLKKIYFDTCLHYQKSLELLIGLVGSSNVLFGTENPGSGSAQNPETGRSFDDIRPLIESIDFLTAEDHHNIFEGNARRLFTRFK